VTRAAVAATPEPISSPMTSSDAIKGRNLARNQRGLQWAYDTFEGAFDVAKKSFETAFELIGDALDSYSSLSWSHIAIFVLVITNIWTIWRSNGNDEAKRKKEMLRSEERERWVKEAVTTLWQELAKNGGPSPHPAYVPPSPRESSHSGEIGGRTGSWKEDVEDVSRILDELQVRLDGLKAAVREVQTQAQSHDQTQGSLSDLD
jgi:hypothetical protein